MSREDEDPDSVPIYVRLQKELLQLIDEGQIKSGGRVPSERELSLRFGASRMTMRKAIDHLVLAGALERRGTSGTFVPERLLNRPLSDSISYSISEVVEKAGHVPGSKLLYFERKEADDFIASRLGLRPGEPVISIERQRTIDGSPVCVEFSHIPARLVPGLSASDVMENRSLYRLLRDNYKLHLRNKSSVISIYHTTKGEAELLDLRAGSAVLRFEALSVTDDGQPFEHLNSLNHPERVSFSIRQPGSDETTPHDQIRWTLKDQP